MALFAEFSGIVHGNANEDDFGFVDTQPGFVDGQGLIFLQNTYHLYEILETKPLILQKR